MSRLTQNALKHRNAKKNFFTPFDPIHALRIAQPYLPLRSLRSLRLRAHILSRFAPSDFALATYPMTLPVFQVVSMPIKFHHDRIKTMGARGIQTYIDSDIARP